MCSILGDSGTIKLTMPATAVVFDSNRVGGNQVWRIHDVSLLRRIGLFEINP